MDERVVTAGLDADVDVRVAEFHLQARLDVVRGQTVAIVGPNGAGKSTFLRALAGLAPLDSGRISIDGRVLEDAASRMFVPVELRPIGVVFQEYLLFPHLSALDNVAFGWRTRGVGKSEARARALEWLARVGLSDRAGARPKELSGGEAQRVALARALAVDPALLLLDEPLSALDATVRTETRHHLRKHLRDHDGCRVLVTHDVVDAAALADRLVVLENGRVVQTGTLDELAAHPRSRYVADLVGVNLIAGRAASGRVSVGTLEIVVAEPVSGDVLLVVPPRAVTLSRTRPEGTARNVWSGRIDAIDPEGDRARVRVVGPVPIVAEITAASVADFGFTEGTEVWAAVKATEIQVVAD